MRYHGIADALNTKPFTPFVMKMVDGLLFDVRHPELLSVTRDAVYLYAGENKFLKVLDLLHIQMIEYTNNRADICHRVIVHQNETLMTSRRNEHAIGATAEGSKNVPLRSVQDSSQ